MKFLNLFFIALILSSFSVSSQMILYKQKHLDGETRVNDLLQRMTLDEKIDLVSSRTITGKNSSAFYATKSIKRLDIPSFKICQGPYGVNTEKSLKNIGTYYPVPINMASTWNPKLIEIATNSLSKELTASGAQSNAGPSVNIIRDLRGGRSYECFTEDPYLNGKIASSYVKGIQSQRNIAILKNFVCNNQEREKNNMNVVIDERALREIYLPGFKTAIIKGGALGVMTSSNAINGKKSSENKHLIQEILKDEWGFRGVVMTNPSQSGVSTYSMVEAGIDLETPVPNYFSKKALKRAIRKNNISEASLNEMVRRILTITFVTGLFDNYRFENSNILSNKKSISIARKVAEESFVLLQNKEKLLPINKEKVKSIAVIGPNGNYGKHYREGSKTPQILQGGGSSSLTPKENTLITPLVGLQNLGSNTSILYEPGCYGDHGCTEIKSEFFRTKDNLSGLDGFYYNNDDLEGEPIKKIDKNISFSWDEKPNFIKPQNNEDLFSVKWTAKIKVPVSREYIFEIQSQGTVKVYINKKLVVYKRRSGLNYDKFAMGSIYLDKGTYDIRVDFKKTNPISECKLLWDYGNDVYLKKAIALAEKSEIVIMPLGTSGLLESESIDRDQKLNRTESLSLSLAQERLIDEINKVNKNIIVVTYTSGVVCEKWKNKVKSIIYAGFPGQEGGNALAKIIYGNINPSGKLPISIPKSVSQYPKDFYSYNTKIEYNEGIYVGYRFFEKNNIEPSFPFGHGLSYTDFSYNSLSANRPAAALNKVIVKVEVKNTGSREGKEVIQLYVSDVSSTIDRPKKELKAFKKIKLMPGESKTVTFKLDDSAFAYFNVQKNRWVIEPGMFQILAGSSSKDIRKTTEIKL